MPAPASLPVIYPQVYESVYGPGAEGPALSLYSM